VAEVVEGTTRFLRETSPQNPLSAITWWRLAYADLLAARTSVTAGRQGSDTDGRRPHHPSEIAPIRSRLHAGRLRAQVPGSGLVDATAPADLARQDLGGSTDTGVSVCQRSCGIDAIDQQMSKWRWRFFYNGVATQSFSAPPGSPTEAQEAATERRSAAPQAHNEGKQFAPIDAISGRPFSRGLRNGRLHEGASSSGS
jgi:hypothetical protein